MNKTTLLAAVLLLGASATGIGAASGDKLQGSDTLKDMTKAILNTCTGAAGLDYVGGSSGAGEDAMSFGTQEIAPMSRFLKAGGNVCKTRSADLTKSQSRVVGFDGIAVVTDNFLEAPVSADEPVCGTALANGTGSADGFDVFQADGTTPATNCSGCEAGTNHYKLKGPGSSATAAWKDVLRLIYFGMDHTVPTTFTDLSTQACAGDVRRSLVNNFSAIFKGGCSSLGECTGGLQHAFRRDDLSGTTDTFISLLNAYTFALSAPSGTGTLDGGGNFVHGASPFCNGRELEDRDPIRRACFTPTCNTSADCSTGVSCTKINNVGHCYGDEDEDDVCSVDGKLGLVLPIVTPAEPDFTGADTKADVPTVAALYGAPACPTTNKVSLLACAKYTDYKSSALVFQCPDHALEDKSNVGGSTFTPTLTAGGGEPCTCTGNPNACKTVFPPGDHRAFNLVMRRADGSVVYNVPPGTPAGKNPMAANTPANRALGFGAPNFPPQTFPAGPTNPFPATGYELRRFYPVINAYWRLRGNATKPAAERCALNVTATACTTDAQCDATEGQTCIGGFCTLPNSDTRQIGCLSSAVDCSIGYAGKEAATSGEGGINGAIALDLNDVQLTDPNILSLTYPLSRKLYLGSLKGLQGCLGAGCTNIVDAKEKALAGTQAGASATSGCYGDLVRVQAAATKATFVATPSLDCQDFDETTCNSVAHCSANTDCATGQTCTSGVCSCGASTDCPAGRTCVAGACTFASNTNSCL